MATADYFQAIQFVYDLIGDLGTPFFFAEKLDQVRNTWLKIFFENSLCFIGLGLEKDELFLRWLLIQRYKYFKHQKHTNPQGWYIHCKKEGDIDAAKKFFLKSVGVDVVEVSDYKEIYDLEDCVKKKNLLMKLYNYVRKHINQEK